MEEVDATCHAVTWNPVQNTLCRAHMSYRSQADVSRFLDHAQCVTVFAAQSDTIICGFPIWSDQKGRTKFVIGEVEANYCCGNW